MTSPPASRSSAARSPRQRAIPLSTQQLRWLGSLLLATQLPMLPFVPLWIACLGTALVGLRFVLIGRAAGRPGAEAPADIRSWMLGLLALVTAIAIRQSLGYFVGRDPCVAFLFALIGIKFLETRTERDGTMIVCLACLLIVTPFFYSQSLLIAAAAIPAVLLLGGALQVLARPVSASRPCPEAGARRWPRRSKMFAQGIPLAVTLFVVFPRVAGPLWGVPADHAANSGLSDHMAPGIISELSLSDAVAFRVDFDGSVPPPWLRYWRGPVLSDFDGRGWTMTTQRSLGDVHPVRRPAGHLHGHARAALEAVAVRARSAGQPAAGRHGRGGQRRAHRRRMRC